MKIATLLARLAVYTAALFVVVTAQLPGPATQSTFTALRTTEPDAHTSPARVRSRRGSPCRHPHRAPSPEARMALKNTAPIGRTVKAAFNWVTQAGASTLKNLPFGGALGVVTAGVVLWLAPHLIPEGWSAEAVLSLGMGGGIVIHRLLNGSARMVHRARAPSRRGALGGLDPAQQARGLQQAWDDRRASRRTCSLTGSSRTTSMQRQGGGASRPLGPVHRLPLTPVQDFRNSSRSALNLSFSVAVRPCAAPWYTLSVAFFTSFDGLPRRVVDRHDLVVVAVDEQRRDVDLLQVLRQVRLGERLDAVVGAPEAHLHRPEPERLAHSLARSWRPAGCSRRTAC